MRESLRFRLRDDDRALASVAGDAQIVFTPELTLVAEERDERWPVLVDARWAVGAVEERRRGEPVGSAGALVDRPG